MSPESLNPNPDLVRIEQIGGAEGAIVLELVAVAPTATCPKCGQAAARIHSRYRRVLHDLPWQGQRVRLHLATRRFFCDASECVCGVFTERFPGIVGSSSRRSVRQQNALTLLAYALGGEAGSRVAQRLGMPASPDTLLRLVVNADRPKRQTPKVLGVDDWAFRKGQVYGTILMDLETGEVVDLLPDRRAETLANWLKEHPGVEEIVRDRAGNYAEGARDGAPEATQIADRWHLLKNLVDALEKLFQQEYAARRAAAAPAPAEEADPEAETATDVPPDLSPAGRRRQTLYEEVRRRAALGSNQSEIAAALGISRNTVLRYLAMADLPPPTSRRPDRTTLTQHEAYLRKRWQEGQHNAQRLWEELRLRGYGGSASTVQRFLAGWRDEIRPSGGKRSAGWFPSAKQTVWWLLGYQGRNGPPAGYLERLEALAPRLAPVRALALRFWKLVRQQEATALPQWLDDAAASEIKPLVLLAASLRRDLPAVRGALESPWSTGPVEGQNNRLKMIKRQMYGRAGLKLLRARVLDLG